MTETILIDIAKIVGPIGIALIVIWLIVEKFLNSQKEFIKFIEKQEESFETIIKNHLHSDTEAKYKLENSNLELVKAIEELIELLKEKKKEK